MQPSILMIGRQSRRCADGSSYRTASASSAAPTTPRRPCVHLRGRPTSASRHDQAAIRPPRRGAIAHHFHDLRHPYATGPLKAGVHPKVINERIGHADVGFFLQTYTHVLKDDDQDVAEQAASIPPASTAHPAPWPS